MKAFTYLIIGGNILFILWMLYNGINEGFTGSTGPQIASYIGLTVILIVNSILIFRKGK